jgi:predicted protein tyrosine phosphatase
MRSSRSPLHEKLCALGWFQFQNLVAAALRKKGYHVEPVPRPAAVSTGMDLILRRDGETVAVRCSHGAASRVGVRVLRRFAEARIRAGIPAGLLVSAAGFTDEVHEQARSYQTTPWDLPEVTRVLEDTLAPHDPALMSAFLDERRLCPYCEDEVTSAAPRLHPQPGIHCLGCTHFPTCVYTLGIWAEHDRLRRFLLEACPARPGSGSLMASIQPMTMKMVICPREAAHSRMRFEPTHMVSLQDPGADLIGLRPEWIPPENHYVGVFCDVRDPRSPEAPQESTIRSVISWLQPRCGPGSTHRFLVHCHAGVGRSPAVGYVAWAIHLGPGREQEAWQRMLESCIKRSVMPNSLIIGHADTILGRQGALCGPLNRWSLDLPWSRTW